MSTRKKSLNELKADCIVWNHEHPVGTRVLYHPIIGEPEGRERVTRTPAEVLSGHTAVVWLEGERGCVCLEACEVLPEKGGPA
jgi:hypothetical protein